MAQAFHAAGIGVQRAGIFTHPFLLSAYSYAKGTSPIHRGVFLTRKVMGRVLKQPPMAVKFEDEQFDPSLTMREVIPAVVGVVLTKRTGNEVPFVFPKKCPECGSTVTRGEGAGDARR